MKKSGKAISILLIIVLLINVAVVAVYADDKEITVTDDYTVVYGQEILSVCAEKLCFYTEKICGYSLKTSDKAPDSHYILISTGDLSANGYNIREESGNIYITGSSLQNTVRGVYGFLEKFGGVKCYTKDIYDYTKIAISIPVGTDYNYSPFFEYTETDWMSPHDTEYSLFNGLNGSDYRTIPDELGGMVDYISSFAHTLSNQFCSADKYFKTNPEYFARSWGMRTKKQLCLTNPDVLEIVKKEVFEVIEEKYDESAPLQIISLTQDDNIAYCTCKNCRETDKKYGSHAGSILEFVNAIAREVKAAGYDNIAIDTFAYRYSRTPPVGIVPEDNVIIRLCSIECCFSHAIDDPDCEANASFMEDLKGWSEISNRLYIWDYCTDFCNYTGIFPNFGVLQRNIQVFYENSVKGIYEEGNYSNPVADIEFNELRGYLISKLYQDPYQDYNKLRDDFLEHYYGDGAGEIGQILDIITENAGKSHLGIYQSMKSTLTLNKSEINSIDTLWDDAIEKTEGTAKQNILNSQLCWRYWKLEGHKDKTLSNKARKEAEQKLEDDIAATGVTILAEVTGIAKVAVQAYQYLYFKTYKLLKSILDTAYAVH